MDGWIKLHRKILENPIVCKDGDHFLVWCFLLLNATHKKQKVLFGKDKIELQPGQLITGRKKIAEATGVSESKVTRILNLLKSEQQIEQRVNNCGSLISIVSWSKYQLDEHQSEQRVNSDRTASEQRVNTNKNGKNVKNDNKNNINININNNNNAHARTHEETEQPLYITDMNAYRTMMRERMNERGMVVPSRRFNYSDGDELD